MAGFKVGDRVDYCGDKATVLEVVDDQVNIQFDGERLWPGGDWYHVSELELVK